MPGGKRKFHVISRFKYIVSSSACDKLLIVSIFEIVVQLYLPVSHVAPVYPVPVQLQVKLPAGVLSQVPPFKHGVPVMHSSTSAIRIKG